MYPISLSGLYAYFNYFHYLFLSRYLAMILFAYYAYFKLARWAGNFSECQLKQSHAELSMPQMSSNLAKFQTSIWQNGQFL